MENTIGRYCELNGIEEVKELEYGMDFRLQKYRREVFLRFYGFHLNNKAHAGAVYYMFPYLFDALVMTKEQKYWFCYINGCCQNVITTYLIWRQIPDLKTINMERFTEWYRANYEKLGWDTDRRYIKNSFEKCILDYKNKIGFSTQEEFFASYCDTPDPQLNFRQLWNYVMNNFNLFGRLSTFSYLEYLKIAGLNIDCDSMFLDDISGSKSHRNGLCKVLGRDDLDWNKNDVKYSEETIEWLAREADMLIEEAKHRFNHPDINYFTLETTLCCYKSWFRPNRRYPNVYNDMFHDRIKYAEKQWGKKLDLFWEARSETLPINLLLEHNPADGGVCKEKQNHFRNTGQVIMMDLDYDCFKNDYNEKVNLFN
ncbi:MAG: hypothetical protein V4547_16490 [Bacteroidota bacterium]